MNKKYYLYLLLILLLSSCKEEIPFELTLPNHFSAPLIPLDNKLRESRINLGKMLFFDPLLSKDSTVSCASCHIPRYAFSDTVALSRGVNGELGKRNSPSLLNIAYAPKLFRDGGVNTLEHQVISPIENPSEMNFELKAVANRLAQNKNYQRMSQKAYQRDFSTYVLVRALAAFERTLISGNSRYDLFFYKKERNAITEAEKRGMALFFDKKTQCSTCHSGVFFTNFNYENNGLYTKYEDIGRAGITMRQEDKALFKVPSLRNVWLTAPYMHDGSLPNLESVIAHYNTGGKAHPSKSELVRPLNLSNSEQSDLVAFLKTLTEIKLTNSK
ncbi:MAG: cytochrome-c peroxidase [Saprospiraceae bacterium]